jgi:hypothetical protein
MLPRRCACGATTGAREFWRCEPHRAAHAVAALARGVATERDVLAALAFDFPDACALDEVAARLTFIANAWESPDTLLYVANAHAVDTGALAPLAPITHRDVHDLLESYLAFVARHFHLHPSLATGVLGRVRAWYPYLVRPGDRAAALYAERILRLVERATGAREFLVLADVALALCPRLGDAAELVYAAYLRGFHAGPIRWRNGRALA